MPFSYWPIFPLSLLTVPEVFARVNTAQFLSRVIKRHFYILTRLVTIGQSHTSRKKKSNFALWNLENINCTIHTYCFGGLIWMVTPRNFIQGFKTKFYVSLTHPRVKLLRLQQIPYLLQDHKTTQGRLRSLLWVKSSKCEANESLFFGHFFETR